MERTRWTVRISASEGGRAKAYARKHSFEAGAPLSFDVEHPDVTALEYLLGAVGTEIASGVGLAARRLRVEVDDVEVLVHAYLHNPMVYLRVVDEEGDPGIESIEAKVYISSFDDGEQVERVWREMNETSPVLNTLRKATNVVLKYQHVL